MVRAREHEGRGLVAYERQNRQSQRMLTEAEFAAAIRDAGPETRAIYVEHLSDNGGELLLHPFVARIRDRAIAAFGAQDDDLLNRILGVMVLGLEQGDERVVNAVEVSFVEDSCWYDPATGPFIASWPQTLRAEVTRQRTASEH